MPFDGVVVGRKAVLMIDWGGGCAGGNCRAVAVVLLIGWSVRLLIG